MSRATAAVTESIATNKQIAVCPECSGVGRIMVAPHFSASPDDFEASCPSCKGIGAVDLFTHMILTAPEPTFA